MTKSRRRRLTDKKVLLFAGVAVVAVIGALPSNCSGSAVRLNMVGAKWIVIIGSCLVIHTISTAAALVDGV